MCLPVRSAFHPAPAHPPTHPKGSSICTPISSIPNIRKAKMPESSTENQEYAAHRVKGSRMSQTRLREV